MKVIIIVSGTDAKIRKMTSKGSLTPAHVMSVWFSKDDFVCHYHIGPGDFLVTHDTFVPSKIVFDKHVFLLTVSDESAVFLACEEDITDTRRFPFLPTAQKEMARKLIALPTTIFYPMMENVETRLNEKRVVWLFHTDRSGSTAWTQMFNSLPDWTVYATLQGWYGYLINRKIKNIEDAVKSEKYESFVVALIKHHMIKASGKSIVFKLLDFDMYMIPIISKHFPEHKMLFGYRDCLPSSKSYFKAFYDPTSELILHLAAIAPFDSSKIDIVRFSRALFTGCFNPPACIEVIRLKQPKSFFEWCVLKWAANIAAIQNAQSDGHLIKCLQYGKLVSSPRELVKDLFNHLGISEDLLEVAMDSFQTDSQAGTYISQQKMSENKPWKRTKEVVEKCNGILEEFSLPDLDSSLYLDHTL